MIVPTDMPRLKALQSEVSRTWQKLAPRLHPPVSQVKNLTLGIRAANDMLMTRGELDIEIIRPFLASIDRVHIVFTNTPA